MSSSEKKYVALTDAQLADDARRFVDTYEVTPEQVEKLSQACNFIAGLVARQDEMKKVAYLAMTPEERAGFHEPTESKNLLYFLQKTGIYYLGTMRTLLAADNGTGLAMPLKKQKRDDAK
jgi:hypothetical protein